VVKGTVLDCFEPIVLNEH